MMEIKKELKSIADFLGCNDKELIHEGTLLIESLVKEMIGEAQTEEDANKLVKENVIMHNEPETERYGTCISRVFGYNQKRQEIINIANKYKIKIK